MSMQHENITGPQVDYDWATIRDDYMNSGNATLRSLSKKYGCSFSMLTQIAKQEQWYKTRTHIEREIERVIRLHNKFVEQKWKDFIKHRTRSQQTMIKQHNKKPGPPIKYDWAKIREDYITHIDASFRSLSEKYGCSTSMLTKIAGKEKWFKTRMDLIKEFIDANSRPK